jgi:hypothetical protein
MNLTLQGLTSVEKRFQQSLPLVYKNQQAGELKVKSAIPRGNDIHPFWKLYMVE